MLANLATICAAVTMMGTPAPKAPSAQSTLVRAPAAKAPAAKPAAANPAAVKPTAKPRAAARPTTARPTAARRAAPKFQLLPVEVKIVEYTNAERARYGLPALTIDQNLVQSARRHATWMTNVQSLQHTNQAVAENIAMGQSSSSEVVRDWMNSSGHRANILNRGHRRIGVAAFRAANGTCYWCQQFSY